MTSEITANNELSEARQRSLANLKPFQKGHSGNPDGRPPRAITQLLKRVNNGASGKLADEYVRLCLEAKDERVRAEMLKDLYTRLGLNPLGDDRGGLMREMVIREYGGFSPSEVQ